MLPESQRTHRQGRTALDPDVGELGQVDQRTHGAFLDEPYLVVPMVPESQASQRKSGVLLNFDVWEPCEEEQGPCGTFVHNLRLEVSCAQIAQSQGSEALRRNVQGASQREQRRERLFLDQQRLDVARHGQGCEGPGAVALHAGIFRKAELGQHFEATLASDVNVILWGVADVGKRKDAVALDLQIFELRAEQNLVQAALAHQPGLVRFIERKAGQSSARRALIIKQRALSKRKKGLEEAFRDNRHANFWVRGQESEPHGGVPLANCVAGVGQLDEGSERPLLVRLDVVLLVAREIRKAPRHILLDLVAVDMRQLDELRHAVLFDHDDLVLQILAEVGKQARALQAEVEIEASRAAKHRW